MTPDDIRADRPERIWAYTVDECDFDNEDEYGLNVPFWHEKKPVFDATEYIRADLHTAQIAALEAQLAAALARAEKAEADLREARMQMLSDAGQAAEAYEAQLKAEAQCDAVMKDRAQIMRQRDAALARVERGMKACDLFDGPVSKSQFVNGQATAAQQIRAALAGDAP